MKGKLVYLSTDSMGQGDERLGGTILESLFTLLKHPDHRPAAVFAANRGVLALTSRSLVSVHAKELADSGVPVLACQTCTDFYDVTDELAAGDVSSMGDFIRLAEQFEVVTIA